MKVRATALALLALARPPFMFLVISFALIGSARAGDAANLRVSMQLAVSVGAWALFAATVNDIADRDVDRANLGHTTGRPIADGILDRFALTTVIATSATAAITGAALLSWRSAVAIACGMALALAYSLPPFKLSSRGAVTSVLLPLVYVVVPYATGLWATGTRFDRPDALLLLGLYISFIGRLMLKDFRDQHGDALYGKRTFLVRYGRARTCTLSAVLWIVGAATILLARRSVALAVLWLPLGVLVVAYLVRVARDEWGRNDVYHIAIIAIAGRGTIVMLLADLGVRQVTSGMWLWSLTQAALLVTSAAAMSRFAAAARAHARTAAPLPAIPPAWQPTIVR